MMIDSRMEEYAKKPENSLLTNSFSFQVTSAQARAKQREKNTERKVQTAAEMDMESRNVVEEKANRKLIWSGSSFAPFCSFLYLPPPPPEQ